MLYKQNSSCISVISNRENLIIKKINKGQMFIYTKVKMFNDAEMLTFPYG